MLVAALLLIGIAEATSADESLIRLMKPFVERWCVDCHGPEEAVMDLDLARKLREPDPARDSIWEDALERLRERDMPPSDALQPSETEYLHVVRQLEGVLGAAADAVAPGHVTVRRLNRVEYRNTVRDLLGVDFDATRAFPADDVGEGFDNIGDVLSLSPMLLEKYLAAAEQIAAEVIVLPEERGPRLRRFAGPALKRQGKGSVGGELQWLTTKGQMFEDVSLSQSGSYVLRGRFLAQQAGPERVRVEFRVDGRGVAQVELKDRHRRQETHEVEVQIEAGPHRVSVAFLNDFFNPDDPNPERRDRNLGVAWLELDGPAGEWVLPEGHRRWIPHDGPFKALDLTRTIRALARRAFRLPVGRAEVERLKTVVEKSLPRNASFEEKVQVALVAVLVSPRFLYRIEESPEPEEGNRRWLSAYELASRLSYFLWSSMPDDELLAAAEDGTLTALPALRQQALRMLQDPRSFAISENFATQWLQIRSLGDERPDPQMYPHVDGALLQLMRDETVLFFDAVLRERRSIWELLGSNFTFGNDRLSNHYGVRPVEHPELRRALVDETRRGGILSHASILIATSHPTRTSPVRRGKWILEALLDAPPPPPPPGFDSLLDGENLAGLGLRERMERHRADPECAGCHARMDAFGFAMEHLDPIGRWRDEADGVPIDAAVELPGGRALAGFEGLIDYLREGEAFPRSLAHHLCTYALGRSLTSNDRRAVDRAVRELGDPPSLERLILAIVSLEAFRSQGSGELLDGSGE